MLKSLNCPPLLATLWLLAAVWPALIVAEEEHQLETEAPNIEAEAEVESPPTEEQVIDIEQRWRLTPRRDFEFRLSPNVGLRTPLLSPLYSKTQPDYLGTPRERPNNWALAASLTTLTASGERDSGKAQEFRDLSDGVAVGVDAQLRTAKSWLRLSGRHLLRDDHDVRLELRHFGVFKTSLYLNAIPHNYVFDTPSLYRGVGSGRLTIDDATRTSLQGSTSLQDAAQRAEAAVAAAPRVDLGHTRDRLRFDLDFTLLHPLTVQLRFDRESRQGTRPWSGSFGFSNFVEIPWPVDYDTESARLTVEYANKKSFFKASYRASSFDNNISSVQFDNPWRLTDQSGSPPAILASYQNGPASGLIDLYPTNESHDLSFTGLLRELPWKGNLSATVAWGRMEQDDPLLPFTTNTTIVPGQAGNPPFDASDPANQVIDRVRSQFDTRLIHLRYTAKPKPFMRLKLQFRDYQVNNESDRVLFPGFVVEDAAYRAPATGSDGFTNVPIAWQRSRLSGELAFDVAKKSRLTFLLEHRETDREFREVAKSEEDRFKVSYDSKPHDWLELKLSYLLSERRIDTYDFAQFFSEQGRTRFIPVLPLLRKFDQAERDRDRWQLIVSFYPNDSLQIVTSAIVGNDTYPDSEFGLQSSDHRIYSADLAWTANPRFSLYSSLSWENFDKTQRSRQWQFFQAGDPFNLEPGVASNSNWRADHSDDIQTFTAGLEAVLVPDKVKFECVLTWVETDGEILLSSPIGEVDANPFDPADFRSVDDVEILTLQPKLELTLGEHLALEASYFREEYSIDDIGTQGYRLVPVTRDGAFNGAILMGSQPTNYDLDVVYLTLKLGL